MSIASNPALIPPVGVSPAGGVNAPGRPAGPGAPQASSGPSFANVLKEATGSQPLHFSRHALERAQRRGIDLSQPTMERLTEGVGRAAGKGSRASVVLVDGTAFVVSVPNRTVITAVGGQQMKDQVFTNVDSAVIA